jgi:hypothetical protein
MFTSSTLSTPTLRRTASEPSPFTPPTNFNKVTLSASPAQQQRQGVSLKKAREIREAFEDLQHYLGRAKQLGLEEKIDSYEYGLQQLEKWQTLIASYLKFLDLYTKKADDIRSLSDPYPELVKSIKKAFDWLSPEEKAEFVGDSNTTVPVYDLSKKMTAPNFHSYELPKLVTLWTNLQSNHIEPQLWPIEQELERMRQHRDRQIAEALKALTPIRQ